MKLVASLSNELMRHKKTSWLLVLNFFGMLLTAILFAKGPHSDGDAPGPGDGLYWLFFLGPLLALYCLVNLSAIFITVFSRRKDKSPTYFCLAALCIIWPGVVLLVSRFL